MQNNNFLSQIQNIIGEQVEGQMMDNEIAAMSRPNKIYEVLGDFETCLEGADGCILVLNGLGQDELEGCPDLLKDFICSDEIDGESVTYKKSQLVVAQIGFRELLDCWNEKHGTNY